MTGVMQFLIESVSAFYIGHSLVSPTLPGMMKHLLEEPVEMQILNGAPLEVQWKEAGHAQGVNGREWLPGHAVEALVITERVPLAPALEYHDSLATPRNGSICTAVQPDVKPYLYQTWDYIEPGPTKPGATGSSRTCRCGGRSSTM